VYPEPIKESFLIKAGRKNVWSREAARLNYVGAGTHAQRGVLEAIESKIVFVDTISGNDTTGTGIKTNPYKTIATAEADINGTTKTTVEWMTSDPISGLITKPLQISVGQRAQWINSVDSFGSVSLNGVTDGYGFSEDGMVVHGTASGGFARMVKTKSGAWTGYVGFVAGYQPASNYMHAGGNIWYVVAWNTVTFLRYLFKSTDNCSTFVLVRALPVGTTITPWLFYNAGRIFLYLHSLSAPILFSDDEFLTLQVASHDLISGIAYVCTSMLKLNNKLYGCFVNADNPVQSDAAIMQSVDGISWTKIAQIAGLTPNPIILSDGQTIFLYHIESSLIPWSLYQLNGSQLDLIYAADLASISGITLKKLHHTGEHWLIVRYISGDRLYSTKDFANFTIITTIPASTFPPLGIAGNLAVTMAFQQVSGGYEVKLFYNSNKSVNADLCGVDIFGQIDFSTDTKIKNVSNINPYGRNIDTTRILRIESCDLRSRDGIKITNNNFKLINSLIENSSATLYALEIIGTTTLFDSIKIEKSTIIGLQGKAFKIYNTGGAGVETIEDSIIEGAIDALNTVNLLKILTSNVRGIISNTLQYNVSNVDPLFWGINYELRRTTDGYILDSPLIAISRFHFYTDLAVENPHDLGAWDMNNNTQYVYDRAFWFVKPSNDQIDRTIKNASSLNVAITGNPDVVNFPERRIENLELRFKTLDSKHLEFLNYLESISDMTVEIYLDPAYQSIIDIDVASNISATDFVINITAQDIPIGTVLNYGSKTYTVIHRYPETGNATQLVLNNISGQAISSGQKISVQQISGAGIYQFIPNSSRKMTRKFSHRQEESGGILSFVRRLV